MNYWTKISIDFANQENYLDELYKVYPTIPEGAREVNEAKWDAVKEAFNKKDDKELLKLLCKFDLFPIKDSYVAYLKKDKTAAERNPETTRRLCQRLYSLGLDEIRKKCEEPKETNRQMGPLFKRWLNKETLGLKMLKLDDFETSEDDAILDGSDASLMHFAKSHLGYDGTKGLDLLARVNKNYVVGEAKFLTDQGGHQNDQMEDAKILLRNSSVRATKIAILDGILYVKGDNKLYRYITENPEEYNIMSALMLKDFLAQI